MTTIAIEISHDTALPANLKFFTLSWLEGYYAGAGCEVVGASADYTRGNQPLLDGGAEEWKAHPRYTGYEVSTHGRIRSIDRISSNGRKLRGKLLTSHGGVYGHQFVNMYGASGNRAEYVHRAVLETFVSPPPTPLHHGCHNNGVPQDNRLVNLRWGTPKENAADKALHGSYEQEMTDGQPSR